MEQTTKPSVLEDDDVTTPEDREVEAREFEFTADLVIELPVDVEPKKFFDYLMRVMIAHTEAYEGSLGGETKWHPYDVKADE